MIYIKILHIVGNKFENGNGIYSTLKEATVYQKKKNELVDIFLLNFSNEKIENVNLYFYKNINEFEELIKINNYDIVIFHGIYFFKYIELYKKLKEKNIKYLIKPHSSLIKKAQMKSYFKKKISNILFFNGFINYSSGVLFANEEEKLNSIKLNNYTYIENYGISRNKDIILPNQKSVKTKMIFISRIDFKHKGIGLLLQVLKNIDEKIYDNLLAIEIYGKGKQKDEKKFKKLFYELGNKKIEFKGPIFGIAKEELLRESNILILTSRYEGFPIILLEALSYGIPCIVTKGTNAAYFEKEKLGWVSDYNIDSLREKIERAIEEYNPNKEMYIKNTQDYVKRIHDWEVVTDMSQKIYLEAIGGK